MLCPTKDGDSYLRGMDSAKQIRDVGRDVAAADNRKPPLPTELLHHGAISAFMAESRQDISCSPN